MKQPLNKVLGIFLIGFVCSLGLPLELLAQVYNPRGKRDPFINLQELFRQEQPQVFIPELPPLSERPLGLVGLAISEVTITGVAVGEDNRVVILKGVDGFTYSGPRGKQTVRRLCIRDFRRRGSFHPRSP